LFLVPSSILKYLYLCNTLPSPNSIPIPSELCNCTRGNIDKNANAVSCIAYNSSLKLCNEFIGPYLPSNVKTSFTKVSVQLSTISLLTLTLLTITFVSKLSTFLKLKLEFFLIIRSDC